MRACALCGAGLTFDPRQAAAPTTTAPGRAPLGREVRGHKTVPDCHSELWLSYQDELVTEASDYFKTKPWQRMTDRNRQHMQGMADKFEDLRKSRQKAEAKVK